jgi:transcription factor E2F3
MEKDVFFVERDSKNSDNENYHSHATEVKTENNNTLGSLTKKFLDLIIKAQNQTIEIHEASERLCIQKRRIYDITNVLEGIGYI